MVRTLVVCCLSLVFVLTVYAGSPRVTFSLNELWKFSKNDSPANQLVDIDDSEWEKVTIPHTWNKEDATDDIPAYYRGIGWYRKAINIPADKNEKQVYIHFSAVNQETELFINGQPVGYHAGGYTAFCFDITRYLKFGALNHFAVKVDNSHNVNIPPLSADFTFFGGIYRDVNLIYTEKQHISTTDYASSGVYINTPQVSQKEARISIKTILSNDESGLKQLRVEHLILSPDGSVIISETSNIKISGFSTAEHLNKIVKVSNPALWSPDSPTLYKVITRVYNSKTNVLLDEVINPLAFRWYEFSAEKGFFLNGKSLKLIGTNRHENYLNKGSAVSDEINTGDVKLLKEMGGNFLRVSHYPQDHTIMEMCDKLGVLCSVEIPIVNAITENCKFTENCLTMTREMVLQDYNRPSVIMWAYMNEILLKPPFKADSVRHEQYLRSVTNLGSKIENQIRTLDPMRYTMIPCHSNVDTYIKAGLAHVPMILGFNLYSGWYGGGFDGLDKFLDSTPQKIPNIPIMITEYGADVDPRLHSFSPLRYDYTQEYANLYHEYYIKSIYARPYVVGATIWNLNDFYSEERANAVPHVNNKGIVTLDREKKDTYLQYQAALLKKPFVAIGTSNWKIRGGEVNEKGICTQPVKIYSNQQKVSLSVNAKHLGMKDVIDNIAVFEIPFINGENRLEAEVKTDSGSLIDQLKVDFRAIPMDLKNSVTPFTEINVMFGSSRYFEDKINGVIWIPEKEYTAGSWGYIGGKAYQKKTRFGVQPASDLNILGTNNDPVFQTMREGLKEFKLDVPDGKYTVSFYWAELFSSKEQQTSIYNLGDDAIKEDFTQRIFDIDINGFKIAENLNLAQEYGEQSAVVKKYEVNATEGKGITINFNPVEGEPILNAIRVYRNY